MRRWPESDMSISKIELSVMQERLETQKQVEIARRMQARGITTPLEALPCERVAKGMDDPPKDEQAPYRAGHELDFHEDILAYCRGRGWIALHGSMAEATHRSEGEWDFVIVAEERRVFLIECKTATGKLTEAQSGMKAWAEKLGHAPKVVRSFQEFLEAVK